VQLRNDDTCVWVMRETKKFLIDNISHHPHLKIEWISVDDEDRVDRIVRPSDVPKNTDPGTEEAERKKASIAKGKQKAPISTSGSNFGGSMPSGIMAPSDLFPVLPSIEGFDGAVEVSDSEDNDSEDGDHGVLKTIMAHFYDVWGVRIFKKEIVAGIV
jgi:hypothetical protein